MIMAFILKCWERLVKLFPNGSRRIPDEIDTKEKLVRGIYSPINVKVNKSTNTKSLQPNAFKSPSGKDEVSILRLKFTTPNFCKKFIKKGHVEKQREYVGLAVLHYHEVVSSKAWAVYSPLPDALMHGDIKTGYVLQRGQAAPAELNLILKDLVRYARFREDPQPVSNKWNGGPLE